jgi:hypothetical protein
MILGESITVVTVVLPLVSMMGSGRREEGVQPVNV